RRAGPPAVVGTDAHWRVPAAVRRLAVPVPARSRAGHGPALRRLPSARVAVRPVRGGDGADSADRLAPAGLRRLLPDVHDGGAVVAGVRAMGGGLPVPVRGAGDVL